MIFSMRKSIPYIFIMVGKEASESSDPSLLGPGRSGIVSRPSPYPSPSKNREIYRRKGWLRKENAPE
jgi:hypothetical protein